MFRTPKKRKLLWIVVAVVATLLIATVALLLLLQSSNPASEPLKSSDALTIDITVGGGDSPQATVVWSGISAASYDYECSSNQEFTNAKKETVIASLGVCQNLNQFSDYFVRVKPEGYEWSKSKSFSTTGDIVIVTGLTAAVIDNGTVDLSWDPVSGNVMYEAQYSIDKDFQSIDGTVKTDEVTTRVTDLGDAAAYYFRVRVATDGASAGATPYSVPVQAEVR